MIKRLSAMLLAIMLILSMAMSVLAKPEKPIAPFNDYAPNPVTSYETDCKE